jgi:hypothetical protein
LATQELKRRGVLKSLFATQIPASAKALVAYARAPGALIAARVAAKSEGA